MALSCLVMAGQDTGSTDVDSGLGGVVTMNRPKKDKSTSTTETQVTEQSGTDVDIENDVDIDTASEDEVEPFTLSDFFLVMFFLSSVIGYFVFCKSNADKAEARGMSGTLWLVLSIFFTPILAWIPLFFIKEK